MMKIWMLNKITGKQELKINTEKTEHLLVTLSTIIFASMSWHYALIWISSSRNNDGRNHQQRRILITVTIMWKCLEKYNKLRGFMGLEDQNYISLDCSCIDHTSKCRKLAIKIWSSNICAYTIRLASQFHEKNYGTTWKRLGSVDFIEMPYKICTMVVAEWIKLIKAFFRGFSASL